MRPRVVGLIGLIALLGMSGCGGSGVPKPAASSTSPEVARVESLPKAEPEKPAEPSFRVAPASIAFKPGDFGAQLTVDRVRPSGGVVDLTESVEWKVEPEGVVSVEKDGYVRPLKPGRATITASLDGESRRVEVAADSSEARSWSCAEDIVPILTRAGCNTGGCHGKADGQNGFKLSLFGYDPESDHQAITRNDGGRRISRFSPESSLLLLKATGKVPHIGGPRIAPDSVEFRTLREWLADGAPYEKNSELGRMIGLRVDPGEVRLDAPGPRRLRVLAKYSGGRERDVTRLSTFRVNDDASATIDAKGRAVLLRRAETDLIVRYGSMVVSARIGAIINPDLKYDFASRPRKNFIDEELFKRLESLKVPPSPPASDAAFLRRVSLDLSGGQPRPEQVREFLKDASPDKREKLVDSLLKNRDFVRFWSLKLGDLLEITSARPELNLTASSYQAWVTAQFEKNTRWDKVVGELLTALGDPASRDPLRREGGPVNYALDGMDAKIQAEKTAQRFLGLRIRCAQCHDHPFDVWTQDDYFGLAAIFAKVDRGRPMPGAMMNRLNVRIDPKGQVQHLRTRKPAKPMLLGKIPVEVAEDEDPRRQLAEWMTGRDNPYFAKAVANWVWAQFFGKGLADPPDDLSRSNPPVHPELLDALAKHFVDHKFDLRDLIRTVAVSEAYALSSAALPENQADTRLFSHQLPRPLTPHQMADALAQVTDVVNRFQNKATGTRAIEISDPSTASAILDAFGRCSRVNGCSTVSTPSLSLRQSLLLIGGDVVESKVSSLTGYLSNLLELSPSPEEIVENLYYRTLCRPPSAEELSHWSAELKAASSSREAAEDLFWALLNSKEFAFNH